MNNRILWIDICKGLAIFLVVVGHTLTTDISRVYIYGFHMPLFFFLSGLVFRGNYTWKNFLRSRLNGLVIPYIFFYVVTYLLWLIAERHFRDLGLDWWQPLIGMLYGANMGNYMSVNGILWFLPCLFSVEVMCFGMLRLPNEWARIGCLLLLVLVGLWIPINLPWGINVAFCALPFFYVGYKLQDKLCPLSLSSKSYVGLAIGFTVCYIVSQYFLRNHVAMVQHSYGNPIFFYGTASIGILMLSYVAKSISPFPNAQFVWGGGG